MYSFAENRFVIKNGNVGIGTSLPTRMLDYEPIVNTPIQLLPQGTTNERVPIEGIFRYNTSTHYYEMYINGQWRVFRVFPKITSVSTYVLKNINDSVMVYGSNFRYDASWKFMGASSKIYTPKITHFINTSNVQLTRPDILPVSDAPYKIQCRQAGSISYYSSIYAGNQPYFTNIGPVIANLQSNVFYSPAVVLNAVDDEGGGILSIEITSNALPPGLTGVFSSENSNGYYTISGTTPNVSSTTTYPFTISAMDITSNISYQNYSIRILIGLLP